MSPLAPNAATQLPDAEFPTLGPLLRRHGFFVQVGGKTLTQNTLVDVSGVGAGGGHFPRSARFTSANINSLTRWRFAWPFPPSSAVTLISVSANLSTWNYTPIGLFDPGGGVGQGHYLTAHSDGGASMASYANNTGWVSAVSAGRGAYDAITLVGCAGANGVDRRISVNGGAVVSEGTTRQPVTLTNIVLGNYFSSGVGAAYQAMNGLLYMAAALPIRLPDFDMRAISRNPWSLFLDRPRFIPNLSRPKGAMTPTVRI